MKLRLAQSFCFVLWCSSILTAQTTKAIDVELHDVTLAEALKDLENKSGAHILFDYKDIEAYQVTCRAEGQTFEQVVHAILAGKPFTCKKVRENTYVIQKADSVPEKHKPDVTLSGLVTDSLGQPVDAAVVSVMNAQTGVPFNQGITSEEGTFSLQARGNIQLYVSCLGFTPYLSAPFQAHQDTTFRVRLQSSSIQLDNVIVVGEKQTPSVRIVNGNTVFFPKNSVSLTGSSALDVLKKTPGVLVDGNDNVSIGGRNGVLIIFNGKPTYMKQEELITMLKSMSSATVTSIEIINNPSAQYDAEGSGGIININTQRQRTEGYSFSVNNGVSYWDNIRQNTELAFSYTRNKFSLMGNYHHQFGYYNLDYGMRRIQSGKEYDSPTSDTDKRKTIAGSLDFEYKFNDRNLIGGQLTANALFGPGQTITTTEIRDQAHDKLEQILYAQNDYYMQKGNRYGANVYYVSMPKEGTKYTLDANYAWFDGGSGNLQPNTYRLPGGDIINDYLYKSVNSRNIHIYALAYNQQHKLGKGELKSGIKFSNVHADNGYQFYEIKDNQEIIDATQSNDFTYKEQILAAYVLYSFPLGSRINMELGLRGEQTWSDGRLFTINGLNNEENRRGYLNVFPSVNLNYQITDEQSLAVGYGGRIDRPAYQDLNPFEYLLDELSYWKGNPFLTPQKTHRVTATYSYKRTSIAAAYTYMKDYKAQITDTLSINKVVMTPKNIGKQQQFSITLNQGFQFVRWWEMNVNVVGYYVKKDIAFDSYRRFNKDAFAGIFTLMNTFRLPWKLQLEVNGSYATRRLGASNEKMEPSGYVDLALGRTFLKKRLAVNLALTDLFWTNNWDNYSSFDGFQLWNWGKGESRQIKLNISYRFGKEKSRSHQQNFEELDRL